MNRNMPTLSGQQTGAFDALTTSGLTVTGNASVAGLAIMSSLGGACITDSLTTYSSTRAASATAVATLNTSLGSYLPTTGGTVTGSLAVSGMLYASNMSVLGSFETVRAYETHSSNVVIDSLGTGPALRVTQTQGGALGAQPVAEFLNGVDPALVIDSSGNVAVNKGTAGYELDVSGTVHATFFRGDGSGLTGLAPASAWSTNGTNVYVGAGSNVGVGTTNPASLVSVYGSSSASMSMNCEGTYYKNLWLGVMGNDHCDSSNAQIRMSKTTGSIFIDPASGVAGNCLYFNQIAGPTAQIVSFGDWYHNTGGLVVLGSGGTTHVGIGKTNPNSAYSLDVSGSVNVSGNYYKNGNPFPYMGNWYVTNIQTLTGGVSSTIIFKGTTVDIGAKMNTTTGVWTCPFTGYYSIAVTLGIYGSATNCDCVIYVNSVGVQRMQLHISGWINGSAQTIQNISGGQTVYFTVIPQGGGDGSVLGTNAGNGSYSSLSIVQLQ